MLPTILHKDQVRPFNFYHQDAIYQGMTLAGQLYKHIASFNAAHRLHAFEQATELSVRGTIVITVDKSGWYEVWADVRLVELYPQPLMQLSMDIAEPTASCPLVLSAEA